MGTTGSIAQRARPDLEPSKTTSFVRLALLPAPAAPHFLLASWSFAALPSSAPSSSQGQLGAAPEARVSGGKSQTC